MIVLGFGDSCETFVQIIFYIGEEKLIVVEGSIFSI